MVWGYCDLSGIVKRLIKAKKVQDAAKASSDLRSLISATEKELNELNATANLVSGIIDTQKITDLFEDTAHRISGVVGSKVNALKKNLTGKIEKSEK